MTGGRLLDVMIKRILTGKILESWIKGPLWEVVAYEWWSHTEVPLYYYEVIVLFWFVFMK